MLSFDRFGDSGKKQIVFCHGLFGKKSNFFSMAKLFAPEFEVFCLDMLSHGSSPRSPSLTYSDFSSSIKEFADANLDEKFNLVGHSMGGKAAMAFAVQNPERLDKLVVLDIAPKTYEGYIPQYLMTCLNALSKVDLASVGSRKEASAILSQNGVDLADALFLVQSLQKTEDGFKWEFDIDTIKEYFAIINSNPIENTDQYLGDSLFLRGGKSFFILDEDILDIKKYFPNSHIRDIANSKHNVHVENSQEVFKFTREFILKI